MKITENLMGLGAVFLIAFVIVYAIELLNNPVLQAIDTLVTIVSFVLIISTFDEDRKTSMTFLLILSLTWDISVGYLVFSHFNIENVTMWATLSFSYFLFFIPFYKLVLEEE
ncbi:hypothetical protein SBRV1_gp22 [Sulfolobales Beppu rod-shaped virus 1]|uniref:Uncharacterized protein n=1 Tax=Sulfolobales Beppu rod-shaped virus 1 TaxID=2493121 RepID=A0A3Q8Q3X9_9VIRU|nr:hypothetical protein QIT32_gp22 [Sulfolobales Beppu rod-shaped virus 1]AZI75911.1 hypothetical protein SBRV1_gp22 [Sulfolobales Beppu rod-shaped virus 1]